MKKYRCRMFTVLIVLGLTWGSISYAGEAVPYDRESQTISENTVSEDTLSRNSVSKNKVSDNTVSNNNTVSGNSVSEDTVSDNTVSDNTVSGNTVSDNTVSDNTVSDDTVSDNTVSDNTVSDNTVSDNTVSENTVSDNTASENKPSGDNESKTKYHYVNLECHEAAYGEADISEKGHILIAAQSRGCPIALLQIENAGAGVRKTLYKGDMQGRDGVQDIERDFRVTACGEYRIWAYDTKGAYDMKTVNVRDMGNPDISGYQSVALKNMKERRRGNSDPGADPGYSRTVSSKIVMLGGDGKKEEKTGDYPAKNYTYKTGKTEGGNEDIAVSERYGNWSLLKGKSMSGDTKAWIGTEAGSGREDAVPDNLQNRLDLEDYSVELFRTDIASAASAKSEIPVGETGVLGLKSKPRNDNMKDGDKGRLPYIVWIGYLLILVMLISVVLILQKAIRPAEGKRRIKDDRKTH